MLTRYVHHDPQAVESPGAGFPSYEDLCARIEVLEEALRPFARLAEYGDAHAPDTHDNDEIGVAVGDLRRARAALNPEGK